MKKILTAGLVALVMSTTASADIARVEMGAGVWMQTPTGTAKASNGDGLLKLKGTYTSGEKDSTEMYVWALIKHPVPLLPNLRLEYVSLADSGKTSGKISTYPGQVTKAKTTIDMTQFDIVPYYNLVDNTFWMTIDAGLDIKIVQTDAEISDVVPATFLTPAVNYTSSETVVVPLLYVRGRVEIPSTNVGLEADVKYITDGDNTVYDVRAKIDYTLDMIPVIQPAIEFGYRIQKFDLDDGAGTLVNLEYSGVYIGAMVRF